jgi:hypothetical protein
VKPDRSGLIADQLTQPAGIAKPLCGTAGHQSVIGSVQVEPIMLWFIIFGSLSTNHSIHLNKLSMTHIYLLSHNDMNRANLSAFIGVHWRFCFSWRR